VTGTDDALRAELLRRVEKDQAVRTAPDLDGMRKVDAENLPWLKAVVAERGWPGSSLVGVDGAHAMWLMVQHATEDVAFMRQCLDLLTAAVATGEASVTDQAFEPPAPGERFTVTCPKCGNETTATFKG
jgi:hypothetical protein